METKATVITPGGRVGNDRSTGSSSNGQNWVERTSSGHLPRYIRIVRNGLMKDGKSEGQATALAVAAIKRWAHGGGNVSPKVQAAAAVALAEWEKMKAEKSDAADLEIADVSDVEFKDQFPANLLSELHDDLDNAVEVKEATMQLETKQAPGVTGLTVVDEAKGIVEAFVSVTNVRDKVGDIIQPGAYTKTLQARKPKGVYAHDWKMPVSKALEVKELLPGNPDLPQHLKDIGAGALKVKMQFNLDTERGRDAYSDVIFYKDEQEWSVGYQVGAGAAQMNTKTGTRDIFAMDLYEYSPVLFGAAPHTSTASVKDLLGFKDALVTEDVMHMSDIRFKELCDAVGIEFTGMQPNEDETPEAKGAKPCAVKPAASGTAKQPENKDEEDGEYLYDEEDTEEGKSALLSYDFSGIEYEVLVKLADAVEDALAAADREAIDSQEHKSLAKIIDSNGHILGEYADEMKDAAEAFDTAYDLNDDDSMNDFGNDVLEVVEKALDAAIEEDDQTAVKALHKVAAAIAAMAPDDEEGEDQEPDPNDPNEDSEGDDYEEVDGENAKPLPAKPGRKDAEDDIETDDVVTMDKAAFDTLRKSLLDN